MRFSLPPLDVWKHSLIVMISTVLGRPRYIDLVFVVDSSQDVNWPKMKTFTKDILKDFDVSVSGTHVAYVVFGSGAGLRMSFPIKPSPDYPYSRETVRREIDRVKPQGGDRKDLQMGLEMAQQAFKPQFGGRPDARKVDYKLHHREVNIYSLSSRAELFKAYLAIILG